MFPANLAQELSELAPALVVCGCNATTGQNQQSPSQVPSRNEDSEPESEYIAEGSRGDSGNNLDAGPRPRIT